MEMVIEECIYVRQWTYNMKHKSKLLLSGKFASVTTNEPRQSSKPFLLTIKHYEHQT